MQCLQECLLRFKSYVRGQGLGIPGEGGILSALSRRNDTHIYTCMDMLIVHLLALAVQRFPASIRAHAHSHFIDKSYIYMIYMLLVHLLALAVQRFPAAQSRNRNIIRATRGLKGGGGSYIYRYL